MLHDAPTRGAGPTDDDDDERAGIPLPGQILAGKLRVESVLGVGGMGVVVAARHEQLGLPVAVKLLRADISEDANAIARFLREARAMAQLRGENIVRVTDVGTLDSGLPYMVMERLVGRDLGDLLAERGRLEVAECTELMLQACVGIAEAHDAGIVHRDLKPPNLFLTRGPSGAPIVKVLDFGVSKVVDAPQALTDTAAIIGSPAYMSPEQIRSSKHVDVRTDIWALGVCLYRLVTGVAPFNADTQAGMCAAIILEEPPPPSTHAPGIPPAFDAVVMRCLTKDAALRFQTVTELVSALRPFATDASSTTAIMKSIPAPPIALPRSGRGARVAVVVAIAASIAIAVTLVALRRESPSPTTIPSSTVDRPSASIAAPRFPPPTPIPSTTTPVVDASASAPSATMRAHPAVLAPTHTPSNDDLLNDRK